MFDAYHAFHTKLLPLLTTRPRISSWEKGSSGRKNHKPQTLCPCHILGIWIRILLRFCSNLTGLKIMIGPVVSALVGICLNVVSDITIKCLAQILKYIKTAISCKEELAALKETLMRVEPIVEAIQLVRLAPDEDSAVDNWFRKLIVLLKDASETVQRCTPSKWQVHFLHPTRKKIAKLTKEIDNHLTMSSLVYIYHICQIQELARKIMEEQRQMNESIEALASSSSYASTSQAAYSVICTINGEKDDKPVTGTASGLSSLSKVPLTQVQLVEFHVSTDGSPSYESTITRIESYENPTTGYANQGFVSPEDRTENQRYGKASNDFTAVEPCELNLTAGEEVQIIYEQEDWFYVLKKRRGRDTEEGFVPKLFINSF